MFILLLNHDMVWLPTAAIASERLYGGLKVVEREESGDEV
jgi:hypothetical protein